MVPGQVVFSKRGRDKERAFMVLRAEGGYVYLTDGRLRPLARPKKKKVMHTQIVNAVLPLPPDVCDAHIRKWLRPYQKEVCNCLNPT